MKKLVILLAVAMLTANTVGCGTCQRMRDWFHQGAYCGPAAAPLVTSPQYVAPTAPCCPPTYMMAPACEDPCAGQASYDSVMPYDSGTITSPMPQTFVTPSPE